MFLPENADASPLNRSGANTPDGHLRPALVPAVAKAFKLLDALCSAAEPLGVSELSRRLEMGKSTVFGLVTTLEALGILETANGTKRYRIGRGLQALTSRAAGQVDIREAARPSLERLAAKTEQTSFLGVPSGDHVTILDLVHGRPTMSVSAPIGSSIPLLAGAVGKAILSAWTAEQRARFLDRVTLPAFTRNTVTDRKAYLASLDECARRGSAVDVDEYVDGMRAAAAPVFGPPRELAAVVWVAGFSRHIDHEHLVEIATEVASEAGGISRRLGASNT